MLKDFETEIVEFKEVNNSYSFKDIGKYFSALGNYLRTYYGEMQNSCFPDSSGYTGDPYYMEWRRLGERK